MTTLVADHAEKIQLLEDHVAHNYSPLDVMAAAANGSWITDVTGRRYLDMLGAYSAMNFGHGNPDILKAAMEQLKEMTLVSRAFHHSHLGEFAEGLTALAGKDMMIPMNSGAEAVETAIKVARKWAYEVKGVKEDQANIVVANNNFHGRTTTIVSFSDDLQARKDFGPFTPGFVSVPFGDIAALEAAVTSSTAAVLLEPVQGEAGVIIPPPDYLRKVKAVCERNNVLLIADEVQSGLARTGRTFACEHFDVEPDIYILGKALGGGVVPVSAVVGDKDVLGILQPGQHGSTFGGNPLACRVGTAVISILREGYFQKRAAELGKQLAIELDDLVGRGVLEARVIGLWAGIDIDPALGSGREVCEKLAERGVLAKDTHGSTLRFSPPLVIEPNELSWAVTQLREVLEEF